MSFHRSFACVACARILLIFHQDVAIDQATLEGVFKPFGAILSCKVIYSKTMDQGTNASAKSHSPKVLGLVQFEKDEHAMQAMKKVLRIRDE